uniref:F-box protein At5g07610-like n=1 Tax=Erigeron canadensis TaxID=72917 RepID=UPI001CB8FCEA|nr:F-box protein At5g07610-like [Erigeron canadensis]
MKAKTFRKMKMKKDARWLLWKLIDNIPKPYIIIVKLREIELIIGFLSLCIAKGFELLLRWRQAILVSVRASKKLIEDDQDHDKVPSSSLYAVISNDDLLIEILLRLPAVSILLSKSVSKRWLSLITGPIISILRCSQKSDVEPPCGIFVQQCMSRLIYDYVPFDIRYLVNRPKTTFRCGFSSDGDVEILQSCNGLFLCHISNPDIHYVYNPSTNQYKKLPPHCNYTGLKNSINSMRLAFDPIKSPYYKLVFAAGVKHDDDHGSYVQIQTYSSKTGTWSICAYDKFPRSKFLSFQESIYLNNALHWLNDYGNIRFKLDVEHLFLTSIPTPKVSGSCSSKLFESRGCLLFVCEYAIQLIHTRYLNIYELSKQFSGWSLNYIVDLDNILPITGEIAIMGCCLCIVLGEKREDLFLVMEICGKIVQYNLLLKTSRELYDRGPLRPPAVGGLGRGFYQLHASFANV